MNQKDGKHPDEPKFVAALQRVMLEFGQIPQRRVVKCLAQGVASMAAVDGYTKEQAMALVGNSYDLAVELLPGVAKEVLQ